MTIIEKYVLLEALLDVVRLCSFDYCFEETATG